MMNRKSRSRGFSLVELLVVVAIIGVMSLVGVPAFLNYQRSGYIRNSLRQFTSDLRGARARAVANTTFVRVNVTQASPAPGVYQIEESRDRGATYTLLQEKRLEQLVYFDPAREIVFQPNGTVQFPAGTASTSLDIKTDARIGRPTYTVTVSISGKVSAQ